MSGAENTGAAESAAPARALDLMIDIEALGKRSGAAITQVSAVWFDPETGVTGSTFDGLIRNSGGQIDVDTVAWWLQQKHAPVLGAKLQSAEAGDEAEVLREFCSFVRVHGKPARVWAHGATFDFPHLQAAFERHGLSEPWSYRAPRDTRGLYDVTPGGMPRPAKDESLAHDALYDCKYQIAQVCEALAKLRQQRELAESYAAYEAQALGEELRTAVV